MQQAERLYEAELVFEEWLAQTEERRNRQMDVIRKQKQKDQHKLPWKPGGFVPWQTIIIYVLKIFMQEPQIHTVNKLQCR